MKSYIVTILLSIVFLSSCDPTWEQRQIDKAKAHQDAIVIDTIFLDFRFGMTPGEYQKRREELTKSGRIKNTDNIYTYEIKGDYEKYESSFEPQYNDNRLYKMIVELKPVSTARSAALSMARLLMEKYKRPIEGDPMSNYQDCEAQQLDKGNLKIKIFCNAYGNVIVTYTDKRVDDKLKQKIQDIKQQLDSIEKKDAQKSIEDL